MPSIRVHDLIEYMTLPRFSLETFTFYLRKCELPLDQGNLGVLKTALYLDLPETLPLLLEAGASINHRTPPIDDYDDTDLFEHTELFDVSETLSLTPLFLAIKQGGPSLALFVKTVPADVLEAVLGQRIGGVTPFLYAAACRNVEAMHLLLSVISDGTPRGARRSLVKASMRKDILTATQENHPMRNAIFCAVNPQDISPSIFTQRVRERFLGVGLNFMEIYQQRTAHRQALHATVQLLYDQGVRVLDEEPLKSFHKMITVNFQWNFVDEEERENYRAALELAGHILTEGGDPAEYDPDQISGDVPVILTDIYFMLTPKGLETRRRITLQMLRRLSNPEHDPAWTSVSNIILFQQFIEAQVKYDKENQTQLFRLGGGQVTLIAAMVRCYLAIKFQRLYPFPPIPLNLNDKKSERTALALKQVLLLVLREADIYAQDINPVLPDIFALADTQLWERVLKRFLVVPARAYSVLARKNFGQTVRHTPAQMRHRIINNFKGESLNITPAMRTSETPAGEMLREVLTFPSVREYLNAA